MNEIESTGQEKKQKEKNQGLENNFKSGILLIAMLILLMATFQLYFSIERIIQVWFEYQYIPIFKAVYNFFVLLVGLYIIRLYIIKR
ncbi:MAG: hypothetical protein PHV51_01615 [Methanosarcinaceae archaeon]|nr:hypothetical protein [Methanosarcinaceae archaeon]MDD4496842.1 hypothetical protein [Methanosarcinaceae archaeon]